MSTSPVDQHAQTSNPNQTKKICIFITSTSIVSHRIFSNKIYDE